MKKVIALMIALLMVLSGCSGNEAELDSLRQEAERLHQVETENAELKQEVERLQAELSQMQDQKPENNEEPAVEPSNEVNPSKAVTQDMLDYIDAQVQSDRYSDWNEVARCDYATEKHLLDVAKKCATIENDGSSDWAVSIAESISNNPACTGKVLKELTDSRWYKVWDIAANSTHADEESLITVANRCAAIENDGSSDWAVSIAESISNNPACTGKVLKELTDSRWYKVWDIAANSTHADEESLITVAERCAGIDNREDWASSIAGSISNNPACTGKVLKELINSKWYNVWLIVANSTHADEESLIAVAERCAGIGNREDWASSIAESISENPACTNNVLKELANSPFPSVVNIGHQLIENMQ